ncbi:unnamed protein product, partial [marine sediment metagenome]
LAVWGVTSFALDLATIGGPPLAILGVRQTFEEGYHLPLRARVPEESLAPMLAGGLRALALALDALAQGKDRRVAIHRAIKQVTKAIPFEVGQLGQLGQPKLDRNLRSDAAQRIAKRKTHPPRKPHRVVNDDPKLNSTPFVWLTPEHSLPGIVTVGIIGENGLLKSNTLQNNGLSGNVIHPPDPRRAPFTIPPEMLERVFTVTYSGTETAEELRKILRALRA